MTASRSVLVLALVLASCGGNDSDPAIGPATQEVEDPARSDERVAHLLEGCGVTDIFDVATSDMLPRMIDKLETGHLDPIKRAKEELGAMGERAVPALGRFVDRNYGQLRTSALVENALDALALSDAENAHPIIWRCMDHPQEAVRLRAARTLGMGHVRPTDYDALLQRFEGGDTYQMRKVFVRLCHQADAAQAEARFLEWIRAGEYREYHADMVALLNPSDIEATGEACGEVYTRLDEPLRASLAAPAARFGHEAARAYLVGLADSEYSTYRLAGAHAMVEAGLTDILIDWLADDRDEQVRVKAAEGISTLETIEGPALDALRAAMDDRSPTVSAFAMKVLSERGDKTARDRAMTFLRHAESVLLQGALTALKDSLEANPALAAQAWEILLERAKAEEHMPLTMRTATLKALGTVPTAEAAEYLHRIGVEYAGEEIEGLPAHRWLMISAGNTGPAGRSRLAELLDAETDPIRRIDLIQAVGSTRTPESRIELQRICEEAARSEIEILYCASLLVRIGPADDVVERLKRVYYRLGSGEVYLALECLLWKWY